MKNTVINAEGYELDFDAACAYMDHDIACRVEDLVDDEAGCSGEQWFFDTYCILHAEAYGEPWELAKKNPVW